MDKRIAIITAKINKATDVETIDYYTKKLDALMNHMAMIKPRMADVEDFDVKRD